MRAIGIGLPGGDSISTEGLRTLYFFSRLQGLDRAARGLPARDHRPAQRPGPHRPAHRAPGRRERPLRARPAGRPARRAGAGRLLDPGRLSPPDAQRHRRHAHARAQGDRGELRGQVAHRGQFGDSTKSNLFTATARVAVDLPLGRNRGKAAVRASELAAESNLRAARALAVQTASDQALETLKAYWEVAAAQERVAMLEHSVAVKERDRRRRRRPDRRRRDAGGRAPRAAGRRSRRRAAQLASPASRLASARAELARAIGLEGERRRRRRPDRRAARGLVARGGSGLGRRRGAARAGARAAGRPRRQRQLRRGQPHPRTGGAHQPAARRHAGAQLLVRRASRRASRSATTTSRASGRRRSGKVAGPSYGVALRFTVPVGNNEARGRLIQAGVEVDQRRDPARPTSSGRSPTRVHEVGRLGRSRPRREVDARREALEQPAEDGGRQPRAAEVRRHLGDRHADHARTS